MRLERSYVLYKSKGPGVAGASVKVKAGGNKGRKMTEQITVGSGKDFTFVLSEVGAMEGSR